MATVRRKVYLAGPISNCNTRQIHDWREELKDHWGHEFEFIDPTQFVQDTASLYEVVLGDLKSIRSADAVLANMWKESIGTSLGVGHAARHGKPVFVVDPNRLGSRTLAYYARAVAKTPDEGMRRVRDYFRSQEHLRVVVKHDGSEEAFREEKLLRAVRRACRAAGRDDLLEPARVVPAVVAQLIGTRRTPAKGKITSKIIRETVWEVLRELEADPLHAEHVAGIREAWELYDEKRRGPTSRARKRATVEADVEVYPTPLDVRVHSGRKQHSSIWGHAIGELKGIPREARRLFEQILRVEGIAEIRLTKKSHSKSKAADEVRAEILASRTARVIEGKCFCNAKAGSIQFFQIRVHDDAKKEVIRRKLIEHLRQQRLLQSPGA